MNIKRGKQEVKNTIEAYLLKDEFGSYVIPSIRQRPVLLIGPPGVGKTQIMEQIARECQIGLVSYTITHHTRQSAIGLPFISKKSYGGKEYAVTEYTMSEIVASIYNKIENTGLKEGILFIDEINCVSETLAPAMLQFLQCKTFGNHRIPEGWLIVAAGNPPEFNKSVREFDVVTLDRIKLIPIEADFSVWKEYAYQENIHPAILSYLDVKNQNFCLIETTVDGRLFATPRGWEDLSRLIEVYEKLDKSVDRDVIFQYIQHPGIAKDFANYLELYYKYENEYQVDEVLRGVIKEELCEKLVRAPFDEKLSVISLVLSKLGSMFQEAMEEETYVGLLMEQLKLFKEGLEGKSIRAESCLGDTLTAFHLERHRKKEAELLGRKEDYRCRRVIKKLESYLQILKGERLDDREQAWERVKTLFSEESSHYNEKLDRCGEALEHGFDFMEAAFGDSQEMVIFITNLNTNYYCIRFLQEYECERYYQYNKKLLFEDREGELKKRIDAALQ
ncbi:AAA family ATPase [Lachnospiraceae bacterium 62-35]